MNNLSGRAFGWPAPEFGHLPNVVNKDGTKLSKRQGDVSIEYYRNQLYYPEAINNFITKSGGGFSDHSVDTIYSVQELADTVLYYTIQLRMFCLLTFFIFFLV